MKLTNQWINGDCLKELKKLPDESIHKWNNWYLRKVS